MGISQGLLDIALLTANASQLKYVLQIGEEHEFYTAMMILIVGSIVLQVIVGVLFLILSGLNINDQEHQKTADILNSTTTAFVFIITIINIIINGFGLNHTNRTVYNQI